MPPKKKNFLNFFIKDNYKYMLMPVLNEHVNSNLKIFLDMASSNMYFKIFKFLKKNYSPNYNKTCNPFFFKSRALVIKW